MSAQDPRAPRSFHFVPPSLLALLIVGACVPGGGAPQVVPRGTLQPGAGALNSADKGPFRVVSASPQGETRDTPEITITFSRPLRALDASPPPPPVQMQPSVPGTWDWVGSRALRFSPEKPLPMGTTFQVEVRGARSIDGSVLEEPHRFTFSTPRPRVVSVTPHRGARGLLPDAAVKLAFNQPVDDAAILASVTLRSEKGAPIPFSVARPDPADQRRVQLTPRTPLPVHTRFSVQVAGSLRGAEGPLPMGKEYLSDFSTYGPLQASFDCSAASTSVCRPGSWMAIQLSNPVRRADLRKALVIEPPVKLNWSSWDEGEGSSTALSLEGAFLPGKTYTVRLRSKVGARRLTDIHGQPLLQDFTHRFEVSDLPPDFNIGVTGQVLEPSGLREIPLFSMNLGAVEVAALALDIPTLLELEGQREANHAGLILGKSGARRLKIPPSTGRNRIQRQSIRVDDLLSEKRGPLAVAASFQDGERQRERFRLIQVTDLGLSAKLSAQESVAWVTRLSTGAPVEGATVEVWRTGQAQPLASVRSDASGLVRLPPALFREEERDEEGLRRGETLLVVHDGKDWAFQRASESLYGWRYGASIESSNRPPTLGLMFTERGLYRPGDEVKVKGVLRQGTTKGMSTPAGQPVRVAVTGPEGDKVAGFEAKLTAFGSFSQEVRIPHGSKLGTYRIEASLGDKPEEGESWGTTFTVAEYRATEFKATAELDRVSYQRGDEVSCVGRGAYLFGAPMAGASARLDLSHQPTYFQPPGLEEHTVDDSPYLSAHPEQRARGWQLQNASKELDGQGSASIKARLDLPDQQGPELVTCEAEVVDLSRQSFAGASSAVVHPGEVYAALKAAAGYFVDAGATLNPELLAVQPDGKRRPGVSGTITLLERTYGVSKQAGAGGLVHTSYGVQDREVASCKLTTAATPVSCGLKVPQGGHYVVRATVVDARGNKVSSSQHVYALGGGAGGWRDQDSGSLTLVTDRKTYRAGDTAKILVQSPFAKAEALVTVEREGVLWQKVVQLAGGTPTIEVPVTEAFLPNAFVSVLLVRGRSGRAPEKDGVPDVGAPTFRLGYAPLVVDTSNRRLKVEVKPQKGELRPGEELSVDLAVHDAAGKGARAEVALYAVDEGVLSLTNYRTPDPVSVFFAPRGIQVRTVESRDALARIARTESGVALGLDKGLDGGGGGEGARRDFRQTAYFNPAVLTDDQGNARVSFKLPEGLTTYRIMAVATTQADRFGSAEAQVITSKPLMARPALPRVLRTEDRFEAGVIVTSKGASGRFEVALAADGLAMEGDGRRTIDLQPGQSQEVRFPASAPRAGKVKLRFDVRGEGVSDSVEVTREVHTPTLVEAAALYGDTPDKSGEKLGDLAALRPDVGGLEVSLSSTALAGLAGGVEQLIEYPYGCTEQLTSRLVPLLPLRDLAGALGLKLPEKVDESVRVTVGKLLNNQQAEGGFGLWPESSDSYPWLTAYALWGLGEAQRRGVPVRASALQAATRYLRSSLEAPADKTHDLAQRAFVLDVLAENGEPDAGAMSRLFEQREQLPLFAQAQLLHALALSKADARLLQPLTRELEAHLRVDGNLASVVQPETGEFSSLLDSPARTTAMVLRALVAAQPSHPMAVKLAYGVLANRRDGTWRNTQETAWSLLALDAYRRAQESVEPSFQARVFLGQALLAETSFQGRERLAFQSSTPMSALQSAAGSVLAFTKEGEGRLFYEARLRFARKKLPSVPLESGFFLDKSSRVVTPESLQEALKSGARGLASAVQPGDLVLVNLTVVAPSERSFVVLDDPIPAGLEPVDTSLQGASSWARGGDDDSDENEPGAWRWESKVTRKELRDDRALFFVDRMAPGVHRFRYLARATTLGTFVAPPTRVEEMYTPETFGQTAAATLTVAARP
ncbi:MAG: MG2 domain-containing protein [Polyangiaceae bacterium]|nr:MG2 domain-containing protein [Polyangiaceae bacterium]